MTTAPWWTEADEAELNIAVWELVCVLDGITDIVRRRLAIQALLDWYKRRCLLSRAEWLRRRHLTAYLDEIAAAEPVVPF